MTGNPFEQAPDPWQAPSASPAGPSPDGGGIPWENEQSLNAMLQTIKGCLVDSSRLFEGAKGGVGMGPALVYCLILGTLGGVLGSAWQFLIGAGGESMDLPEQFRFLQAFAKPGISTLIATPVTVLVAAFVWSGIVHVTLLILGAAQGGFEATFRSVAYANGSVALFQLVPVAGPAVAGIWALIIEILALKALHKTTGGMAAAGVLVPMGLCCCAVSAVMGIALSAVAGNVFK